MNALRMSIALALTTLLFSGCIVVHLDGDERGHRFEHRREHEHDHESDHGHGHDRGPRRLTEPRLPPLEESEMDEAALEYFRPLDETRRSYNIYKTLAHHPALTTQWRVFGGYILGGSKLPVRDRELAILRVGWLCRAEYEWGHHVQIGKAAGISDEEVLRIVKGPRAAGWSPFDAALLSAADELHYDQMIGDATWAALGERYDKQQIMDLIFTIGQYHLVCMALNSIGIQLENGFERLPD